GEAGSKGRKNLIDELLFALVLPGRFAVTFDLPGHPGSEHVRDRSRSLLPSLEGFADPSPIAFRLALVHVTHRSLVSILKWLLTPVVAWRVPRASRRARGEPGPRGPSRPAGRRGVPRPPPSAREPRC